MKPFTDKARAAIQDIHARLNGLDGLICNPIDDSHPDPAPGPFPADPVSGLRPRFKPNTPLPEGAVLMLTAGWNVDYYWIPNGDTWAVYDKGYAHKNYAGPDASSTAAALLGLCEAQPGACRRWGQCVSLAKAESQPCCGCANHEPDEPEPESVEERLRRELADMTKAKDVYRNQMFKNSEAYRKGGRMAYYTKAELIAMLQAKLGTHIGTDNKRFSPDLDLFAAKDAEIKQLKHELDRLGASIVKSGKELVEAGQEWLARNTP